MTILQQYGIFSGGVLTKQPLLGNSILLSPYVLNLFEGSVTGSGDINHTNVTKAIQLSFGVNASPSILRDVLNPPQYKIFVGQLASQIYITYDEGHADIGLSTVFPVNTIIFGVIKWATNNGAIITDTTSPYFNQPLSINTIDIDLSFRTEALVVKTTGGLEATKLYYDSQRYIAGNLNKPLVDSAVVSEVLLAESSLRSGGSFFITLLQDSQIHTDTTLTVGAINLSVILEPCEHIARVGNEFQKFKTKAKTGSSHALVKTYTNITEVVGKYIYILLDKNTGVVSVTENTSVNTVFSNYYVIARSETAVVLTDTDLNNVVFQVLNDIISLTRVQQDTAILQKALNPNGWMNTVTFNETPIANTIHLTEATACINGFGVEIPSQNITLPSPPSTSIAFDIIWLEVEFVADPILRILPTIHVTRTTDNNIINFTDPILHPSIVNSAATPLNFTKEPNNTYLKDICITSCLNI
jgi:uncharacterized membrane protein